MHIGQRIKQVMAEKNLSVIAAAKVINCERTNVYNVFARKDINTNLLRKFSVLLDHDFFKELSEDTFKK